MVAGGLSKVAAAGVGGPTAACGLNLEEQLESETDHTTQGSSMGK